MRTVTEIEAQIKTIEADSRYQSGLKRPATIRNGNTNKNSKMGDKDMTDGDLDHVAPPPAWINKARKLMSEDKAAT